MSSFFLTFTYYCCKLVDVKQLNFIIMEKTPTRLFSMSFDDVITKAQSMQPQFALDIPKFYGFNPWFTNAVNVQLVAQVTAGISDFSASSHTAQIEIQTEAIAQMLKTSGQKFQKLMYYVDEAFGNSKAIGDTFGRSRYEKARQSEKEMVSLLNQAVTASKQESFKTKLVAAGMPETLPNEMETLAIDLTTADGQQEMLKKKQLLVTSERIELFNSIWVTLGKISSAAKIIFAEDPARLAIYQLYDAGSSKPTEPPTPEA